MKRGKERKSNKEGLPSVLRPIKPEAFGNQWVANPKQQRFVSFYMDPNSETFGNAYRSALEAGYSETYSRVIVTKEIGNKWVKEYQDLIQLKPEHIVAGIQKEALNTNSNRGSERLKAYELLAKMNGMLVDRQVTVHASLEQAIAELK